MNKWHESDNQIERVEKNLLHKSVAVKNRKTFRFSFMHNCLAHFRKIEEGEEVEKKLL